MMSALLAGAALFAAIPNYKLASTGGTVTREGDAFAYTCTADGVTNGGFSVAWSFADWEADTYVFLPAAAYNGNRDFWPVEVPKYPPKYSPAGKGPYPRLEINSKVPALRPDGSGQIEVTAGDLSVPCAGFFFPKAKRGVLFFSEAAFKGEPVGYTVRSGELRLDYPARRSVGFRLWHANVANPDSPVAFAKGETVATRLRELEFPADDVSAFLERFFRERKCLVSSPRVKGLYTKHLWEVTEKCWNDDMFIDGAYVQERMKWEPGWPAGPHELTALWKYGSDLTRSRCLSTLDFMVAHRTETGLFNSVVTSLGRENKLPERDPEGTHFIRFAADGLYNLMRCREAGIPFKPEWDAAAAKCADALVGIWRRNGQFGQFYDTRTLEVKIGRSDAGMIAPAALVACYQAYGKAEWLEVAKASAESYVRDLDRGVLYGGPADALGAPDSESVASYLESCMRLHEATKDPVWVVRARRCAALLSTWVMTYAYPFPSWSQFAKLGINTTGSVFANVQNKHSAPGIATGSGVGLLKLYRATGDKAYLELIRDIASYLPQSVSMPEKPIRDRGGNALRPGWMCERVNTSDWEDKDRVGGSIFNASCWCGSSLLTTWSDLLGEPEFADEGAFVE